MSDTILYTWFGKKWKLLKQFWGWKMLNILNMLLFLNIWAFKYAYKLLCLWKKECIPATHVLLDCYAVALIWAMMSFTTSKSRPMVIDNCKVIYIFSFSFQGEISPSIYASSVRFLGTTIDFTVSNKRYVAILVTEVFSGLNLIGKSSLFAFTNL